MSTAAWQKPNGIFLSAQIRRKLAEVDPQLAKIFFLNPAPQYHSETTDTFVGTRLSEYFSTIDAVFFNERSFVRSAILHSERMFLVRTVSRPILIFKNWAPQVVKTPFSKRCTYVDATPEALPDTNKLHIPGLEQLIPTIRIQLPEKFGAILPTGRTRNGITSGDVTEEEAREIKEAMGKQGEFCFTFPLSTLKGEANDQQGLATIRVHGNQPIPLSATSILSKASRIEDAHISVFVAAPNRIRIRCNSRTVLEQLAAILPQCDDVADVIPDVRITTPLHSQHTSQTSTPRNPMNKLMVLTSLGDTSITAPVAKAVAIAVNGEVRKLDDNSALIRTKRSVASILRIHNLFILQDLDDVSKEREEAFALGKQRVSDHPETNTNVAPSGVAHPF